MTHIRNAAKKAIATARRTLSGEHVHKVVESADKPSNGARRLARHAGALVGIVVFAVNVTGQEVDRIEPPSWWVESIDQSVMFLIEGSGLGTAHVRFTKGSIRVERVEPGREGRALFVDATIPGGSPPGGCEIEIAAAGQTIRRHWELVAKPARPPAPLGPDDVIYLVMVDRFANGDPANDRAGGGEPMLDRHDTHAYHGGDFAGVRKKLPELVGLGITAVWLTPIYRQASSWFAGNIAGQPRKMADFHGYCAVDFYDTNPRFGSPGDYRQLVDEAHRLGIKIIQDHVIGHTGPSHRWRVQPPTDDWIHGPLDHPPICTFRFDTLVNPHARESERRAVTDGWFAGILPDLNTRNPRASRYAIQQSLWWFTLFGADGIRLDTYPLVDRGLWRDWSRRLKSTHPGVRAVGEAWVLDPAELSFFQGGRTGWDGIDPGVDSVFDFPLYHAATAVFSGRAPAKLLAQVLGRDALYPRPDLLVTFLDNHDTPRLAGAPGITPARLRLAITFLLTTRGIPQITWGDEIGMPGHMDDRRDFPGGFPGDPRDGFSTEGRTPEQEALFTAYRELLSLRKATPALRRGALTDLASSDTIYAYLRKYESERVVVALNVGNTPADVKLPAGVSRTGVRLHGEGQWIEGDGSPRITMPGESAAIFRLEDR
jgi:glycosidase